MKNIFNISIITCILILSIFLCGYFNYFLIISFILIFHDLGHIFFIKLFKLKITKIDILPTGSIINTNIKYNYSSIKLLLISIGGILMQLVLIFIVNLIYNYGLINQYSFNIFNYYNKLIIIFNLLPIIPLDGEKILLSILEYLFPYRNANIVLNIISIIFIILLFIFNLNFSLILILVLLVTKTIQNIKNLKYIYNSFLLERYLYKKNYKKVKYISNIKRIYKNKYNFINNISEVKILDDYFSKNYENI